MSSPSATCQMRAPRCRALPNAAPRTSKAAAKLATETRLRNPSASASGNGTPRATHQSSSRKWPRTPGPYTSGGRTMASGNPCLACAAKSRSSARALLSA